RLGLDALLLDAAPGPGGQLHLIHYAPDDFAGGVRGDGAAIAAGMADQLQRVGATVEREAAAIGLEAGDGIAAALGADGRRFEARAVLVGSGARRRHLGVPGERELEGRGVWYSATRDRERLAGRRVVVVGGGDSAFENSLLLAATGAAVTLVSRGAPRARTEFRRRVAEEARIEHLEHARVTSIVGSARVEAVCIESRQGVVERPAEGVVVKVGMMPNTEWCARTLDLDAAGFVRVDDTQRSSAARVWAAGDVTRPLRPSISAAVGAGAIALAAIRAVLRPN